MVKSATKDLAEKFASKVTQIVFLRNRTKRCKKGESKSMYKKQ
jgi:hypothetical protein